MPVHSIILDWTLVCFIDSVGAKAIKQVQQDSKMLFTMVSVWWCSDERLCPQIMKEYASVDVTVVIAGCSSKSALSLTLTSNLLKMEAYCCDQLLSLA